MKYLPLLTLSIKHDYYKTGYSSDFFIESDKNTQQFLLNHRCILKLHATGLVIYQAVNTDADPFITLASGTVFRFNLRLINPDHVRFTDLSKLSAMENLPTEEKVRWPVFTNKNLNRDTEKLALVASETPKNQGVFANIEIVIDDYITPKKTESTRYHLSLTAKSVYWEYFFVTNKQSDNPDYQIKQLLVQGLNQPIVFKKETPPSHRLVEALKDNHPHSSLFYFISDNPIRCQQLSQKNIQVFQNGEQLMSNLPNPSLGNMNTRIFDEGGSKVAQDTLFHIVKYISHSLSTTGI